VGVELAAKPNAIRECSMIIPPCRISWLGPGRQRSKHGDLIAFSSIADDPSATYGTAF
jgi:hypothetical protein